MRLLVFSHKVCWRSLDSPTGWATDGGFSIHMDYISSLFDFTSIIVPINLFPNRKGEVYFTNKSIDIIPITFNFNIGIIRKIRVFYWWFANLRWIYNQIKKADFVHVPIPSDIGTVGMIMTFLMKKPLFVRHCGNWNITETSMEKFWKWFMIRFASDKNIFLATGGGTELPSSRNHNIKWIFSSSLSITEISEKSYSNKHFNSELKACIVCRIDKKKGVGIVIDAVRLLVKDNIFMNLTIVGDGPDLDYFINLVNDLNLNSLITFTGKRNHLEVLTILNQNDVFCYPTMASEGFPKVVLEAMSQGLLVITTPVSVLQHLIINEQNGFLINEANSILLVDKLKYINYNRTKLNLISNTARLLSLNYTLEHWREFIKNEMVQKWPFIKFKNEVE